MKITKKARPFNSLAFFTRKIYLNLISYFKMACDTMTLNDLSSSMTLNDLSSSMTFNDL